MKSLVESSFTFQGLATAESTAREQERTRQPDDAFAARHLSARGFACRQHDKIRV